MDHNPFKNRATGPFSNPRDNPSNTASIFHGTGKPTIFDPPSKSPQENRSNSFGTKSPSKGFKPFDHTDQNKYKPYQPKDNVQVSNGVTNQNGNMLMEQFIKQLKLRDNRIEILESQVKMLNETMTLCMKTINEMKTQNEIKNTTMQPAAYQSTTMQSTTNSPLTTPILLDEGVSRLKLYQKLGKVVMTSQSQVVFQDKQIYIYLQTNVKPDSAKDVKIENEFAKIIFRQNVNLQTIKANLSQWIQMNSANVKIKVGELKGKKCEIFIIDFHGFSKCFTPQTKQEIYDLVNNARLDTKFETVEFDSISGMLYTKCKGL